MRNFVQNWCRIDTKIMRNFVQKSHFVQNHETVAQENQLFRGNPTFGRQRAQGSNFSANVDFKFI